MMHLAQQMFFRCNYGYQKVIANCEYGNRYGGVFAVSCGSSPMIADIFRYSAFAISLGLSAIAVAQLPIEHQNAHLTSVHWLPICCIADLANKI